MPTVDEVAAPYANHLIRVLPPGPGVCDVCRTSIVPQFNPTRCRPCFDAIDHVDYRPDEVAIIAVALRGQQLAHELLTYKTRPGDPAIDRIRIRLAALLWKWLSTHEDCVARGAGVAGFPVVTTLPSTRLERQEDHPLRTIVRDVVGVTRVRHRDLLRSAGIPDSGDRRTPDRHRFSVIERSLDRLGPILLIDDTWTSGANAYSAVHALKAAGATKVAVLCLGRWFNRAQQEPFQSASNAYIERARQLGWDWDRCYRDPV